MARILVGVTGGIAAYKAVELVRLAGKAGHAVRVVQTRSSERFVGRGTFEGITGAPVLVEEFEPDPMRGGFPGEAAPDHAPISHLELVARCDAFVIAPASANTIAKLAGGAADNLLTAAALACRAPLLVCPAMNDAMWENAATRANVSTLERRGVTLVGPERGSLASRGEHGPGRLAEPTTILAAVEAGLVDGAAYAPRSLDGLEVLVTAGGTREPIDSVRYVGNRSSGRMGFALAEEAARRGANVTVVAANVSLERDPGVAYRDVVTASELHAACAAAFERADLLLMVAAVADFRPSSPTPGKIKKGGRVSLALELEPTEDVLADLAAKRRPGQILIGFAAEHGPDGTPEARSKLERKGLDAVVVNDVSDPAIGFDSDENEVTVVTPTDAVTIPRAPKDDLARAILDAVERLGPGRPRPGATAAPVSPDERDRL